MTRDLVLIALSFSVGALTAFVMSTVRACRRAEAEIPATDPWDIFDG